MIGNISKAVFIALCLWPSTAVPQGFAGLGSAADGFAIPQRGTAFDFPTDHGPHPEYRIEWWYLTANLRDAMGHEYGVQWTLFRSALSPETRQGWQSSHLWMGHAGLTTADHHFSAERLARGGIGQAGAHPAPFEAWIDDWTMATLAEDGADMLTALHVTAQGQTFAYDLTMAATGPIIFHGDAGYSVKSADGQASYYYSQPFYQAQGTLTLPSGSVAVTGTAWLDREWSSQPLSETQDGWDWFSLRFDDGTRLMAFGLRGHDQATFTAATWITPDGVTEHYPDGALRLTPLTCAQVADRTVPVRWRVDLPARGLSVETEPINPHSWMDVSIPYWEGPFQFSGSHTGVGYLEMTGYE